MVTSRMTRLTPARAHRQPLDVAADLHDILQHALDGGPDGELRIERAELAAGDEQAGAPVEKSPDTGFTPVEALHHLDQHSVADAGDQVARGRVPGVSDSARQPQPGVLLKPPRVALPVDAVPLRRPL